MSMMGYAIAYGAAALIKAGSTYMGGVADANAKRRTAENAYNTALWNAQSTLQTGTFNALMVGNAGRSNAAQGVLTSMLNIRQVKHVAEYNMALQKEVTEYNTALMLDMLPQMAEAYDLNLTHIRQTAARTEGSLVAYEAASGTVVGTGSNRDVIVDSRTQQLMDEMVVGLQYQWDVEAVFDAIHKNEWEGQMALDKMAFDANTMMLDMKNQAALGAFATLSNSIMEQFSIANNTLNAVDSIMWQGASQAATYESAAQASLTAAAWKAGGSLISSAISYGTSLYSPSGGDGSLASFDSGVMKNIAGGQSAGEAIMAYQPPNLMSSFQPGQSLLESFR